MRRVRQEDPHARVRVGLQWSSSWLLFFHVADCNIRNIVLVGFIAGFL